jgi:hypothetical protein
MYPYLSWIDKCPQRWVDNRVQGAHEREKSLVH